MTDFIVGFGIILGGGIFTLLLFPWLDRFFTWYWKKIANI